MPDDALPALSARGGVTLPEAEGFAEGRAGGPILHFLQLAASYASSYAVVDKIREGLEKSMFRMLIDTCVWLDLAKDPKQHPVLEVVEQMVREKMIALLVPRVVLDELRRNRERIEKESARSLATHFKLVKEAVDKAGGSKRRTKVILDHLDDVNHKIPIVGGAASQVLDRIEKLLTLAPSIEESEPIKLRAAQRAIERKAPFHRGKNSMADALIVETYADCVHAAAPAGTRFAFVTHNKSDFSQQDGNLKISHADLRDMFSRIKSLYFINLVEALRRVDPSFVTDTMFEYSFDQQPRGLHEILEAEDILFHQVWYNRHWNMRVRIEKGLVEVVDEMPAHAPRRRRVECITRDTLKLAIESAQRTERRYGKQNLGPWEDFEWGMINGKLSALRWILGDEWDVLDT